MHPPFQLGFLHLTVDKLLHLNGMLYVLNKQLGSGFIRRYHANRAYAEYPLTELSLKTDVADAVKQYLLGFDIQKPAFEEKTVVGHRIPGKGYRHAEYALSVIPEIVQNGFFHYKNTVSLAEGEEVILRFLGTQRDILTALPVSTVEESAPVSDDWFDDVCFIGHSQIVGMQKYSGLSGPDYYAVVGHTAQAVVDYEFYELPDGRYGTLSDALHAKSYGKVYIMLGINDSSLDKNRVEKFMTPMRAILDLVKETQPDAKVYLLSLVPVGRYTPMNELYNPDSTVFYSQLVKTLSREYDTEYIDLFRMMCDKAGYFLNSFNSGDGIHIQSDRYPEIVEYLKRHT